MATSGLYKNTAIEEYVNEFLTTLVDLEGLCTIDNSLTAQPGDTVREYHYTLSGTAVDVTEGSASSGSAISISGSYEDYTVKMCEAFTEITDESVYRNPLLVEEKIKACAKAIFNKQVGEIGTEWNKATNFIPEADASNSLDFFDQLMTAQGTIQTNVDGTAFGQQWLVCTPAYFIKLKKDLKKNNVLIAYDIINGKKYPVVGGIAIKVSDGVKGYTHTVGTGESAKTYDVDAFLVDSTAVKIHKGKSVSSEQARNASTRTTTYFARDNYITTLQYADRVVGIYGGEHVS